MARYLRISVEGQTGYFKAFVNKQKVKEADPDYTGRNIAIWINQSKMDTPRYQVQLPRQPAVEPEEREVPVVMPQEL